MPQWISEWNKDPKPFVWTKTADDILDTLAAYGRRINGSRRQASLPGGGRLWGCLCACGPR
jgi:hypothetical protein